MKHVLLVVLTVLGATALVGLVAYFPFPGLYDFVLDEMDIFLITPPPDPDMFRLKITIVALGVATILIILMILLRKASNKLELKLFHRLLTWSSFYVGVATVIMLIGMWIDFHPWVRVYGGYTARVGFFFGFNTYFSVCPHP
ncbi:hypothetical protein JXM67_15120 [candidate division WOR-3 bacterium]|nr:hypothetical protein [candidate division WOR-3 bacterium]